MSIHTQSTVNESEEAAAFIEESKKRQKPVFKCPPDKKPTKKITSQEREEKHNLKIFFERVRNAPAMVDCSPPRLDPDFITRVGKLRANVIVLKQIVVENKKMAEKINIINRTKGAVVCHNPRYVRRCKIDSRRPEATTIAKCNQMMFERVAKTEANYKLSDLQKEWERNERLIIGASKYPPHWLLEDSDDPNYEVTREFKCLLNCARYSPLKKQRIRNHMRPKVFMDIEGAKGQKLGRMVIVLYRDIVPMTVTNFLALCTGKNAERLTYKNTPFFRINTHLYCLGGDVTKKYGTGGRSIYGEMMNNENYRLKHTRPGMLTMHNQGLNCGNSQFLITFQALPTMDGRSVVFGRVIKGLNTLFCIEEFGTRTGKPKMEVIISNCGQLHDENQKKKMKNIK